MSKKTVAVIDIGSLNARLKIYEIGTKGKPKNIETVRSFVSVGAQNYTMGVMTQEQLNELCDLLIAFERKCKEYKADKVFCVSTSAFRDVSNKDVAIDQIENRTGFKIDILDNSMERFYHNIAVKEIYPNFYDMIKEGTLILDIGAGSLQATVYDKQEFVFSQNMVLGSLRIYEMLSDLQNRTTHYEDVLEEFIAQDLDDYHAVEPKGITYKYLMSFSGEMGFIKKLAGKDPFRSCVFTKEEFLEVYEYLLKTRPTDLTLNNSVPSYIAPLLLPSALITRNMLEYTGVDAVYMPHASLSDGIIHHYCYQSGKVKNDKLYDSDLITSAKNTAKRYKTDKKHIEFVEKTALMIFDAVARISGLTERDRLLLRLSALLHEIGKFVHAKNHNDSAYWIIKNTDFIGIDAGELETIAGVVRLYPKENVYASDYYQTLAPSKRVLVSKLTSILRMADALDASHREKVKKMNVVLKSDCLHITCESNVEMSFEEWSFEHRCGVFAEVMGIPAQLRIRRQLQ